MHRHLIMNSRDETSHKSKLSRSPERSQDKVEFGHIKAHNIVEVI